MEKGNEEISEKAEVKELSFDLYDEIRIEMHLGWALKMLAGQLKVPLVGYRLNNIIIPGYKDIGLQGQAIFILREFPWKNAADK